MTARPSTAVDTTVLAAAAGLVLADVAARVGLAELVAARDWTADRSEAAPVDDDQDETERMRQAVARYRAISRTPGAPQDDRDRARRSLADSLASWLARTSPGDTSGAAPDHYTAAETAELSWLADRACECIEQGLRPVVWTARIVALRTRAVAREAAEQTTVRTRRKGRTP